LSDSQEITWRLVCASTLPAIGNAIGRAYLPDANAKEYVALAKTLMR
jgi:hypothetical protein